MTQAILFESSVLSEDFLVMRELPCTWGHGVISKVAQQGNGNDFKMLRN